MKNLILCTIAFLFLFTSCFEKEEEVTVVLEEEVAVVPNKDTTYIMECEDVSRFVAYIKTQPPKDPRTTIKRFKKGDEFIFQTHSGGTVPVDAVAITYRDSKCQVICGSSNGVSGENCPREFYDSLVFVETVWQDER